MKHPSCTNPLACVLSVNIDQWPILVGWPAVREKSSRWGQTSRSLMWLILVLKPATAEPLWWSWYWLNCPIKMSRGWALLWNNAEVIWLERQVVFFLLQKPRNLKFQLYGFLLKLDKPPNTFGLYRVSSLPFPTTAVLWAFGTTRLSKVFWTINFMLLWIWTLARNLQAYILLRTRNSRALIMNKEGASKMTF